MAFKHRRIEQYKRLLIVEGYSDLLFYAEMLEHLGLHDHVFIQQFNGKPDLLLKLEALLTPQLLAEKQAIAVIIDANGDAAATFARVQGKLRELTGIEVAAPGAWSDSVPRIGAFIAPGDGKPGELETLVWWAWTADQGHAGLTACIERFIECARSAGVTPKSPDKALVGAMLAVTHDEDPRVGAGARARVFDLDHAPFTPLREFLKGLKP